MFEWNATMRPDLYTGSALYYHQSRIPYPDSLVNDLHDRTNLSGHGRLLDLGCGTGQFTLPAAGHFHEVWAVDKDSGMTGVGQNVASKRGISNIQWITQRAELLEVPNNFFELVGIANAFHRLGRRGSAKLSFRSLQPNGHIALVGCETPASIRRKPSDSGWRLVLANAIAEWIKVGKTADRFPSDADDLQKMTDQMILEQAGFIHVGTFRFPSAYSWTIDSLLLVLRSTSYVSEYALGPRHRDFEIDVREKLLACEPTGIYPDILDFHYQLAQRPA